MRIRSGRGGVGFVTWGLGFGAAVEALRRGRGDGFGWIRARVWRRRERIVRGVEVKVKVEVVEVHLGVDCRVSRRN